MQYFEHGGAFHTADDGEALPDGAVALPRLPLEGETWDGTAFVFDGTALLARVHAAINAQAEAVRIRFTAAAPGQAEAYRAKEAEARAWLVDHSASTPILAEEAAAMGITVADLAPQVIAKADESAAAWNAVCGKIEGARRGAKQAASQATDAAGIWAATVINWQDAINGN